LCQHVCDIDLTKEVVAWWRPSDDILPEVLVDPLRPRTRVGPPLYARLLDVSAALAARRYDVDGALILAVHDRDRDQSGTYRSEGGPDGATARRVDAEPDLTMPIDVLASLWLGSVRATRLLAARLTDGAHPRCGENARPDGRGGARALDTVRVLIGVSPRAGVVSAGSSAPEPPWGRCAVPPQTSANS
jgi:hypothetical protein